MWDEQLNPADGSVFPLQGGLRLLWLHCQTGQKMEKFEKRSLEQKKLADDVIDGGSYDWYTLYEGGRRENRGTKGLVTPNHDTAKSIAVISKYVVL